MSHQARKQACIGSVDRPGQQSRCKSSELVRPRGLSQAQVPSEITPVLQLVVWNLPTAAGGARALGSRQAHSMNGLGLTLKPDLQDLSGVILRTVPSPG